VAAVLARIVAGFISIGVVFIASGIAVALTSVVLYPVFKELGEIRF
jgi:hypothetical protein